MDIRSEVTLSKSQLMALELLKSGANVSLNRLTGIGKLVRLHKCNLAHRINKAQGKTFDTVVFIHL